MECWSVGVLRRFRIAPRVRGVGSAFRANRLLTSGALDLSAIHEVEVQISFDWRFRVSGGATGNCSQGDTVRLVSNAPGCPWKHSLFRSSAFE
jgi:hypothetical protein